MNVIEEVLSWSQSRPEWQRDALRRLVESGRVSKQDVAELTAICKAPYGLNPPSILVPTAKLLCRDDLPTAARGSAVRVLSIRDVAGVNAILAGQTLTFAPEGLTVVYGDNGAGKSGYCRILRQVCRARGRSASPLPNVFGPTIQPSRATITFDSAGRQQSATWFANSSAQSELASVSVFDARCGTTYIEDKTDVAFQPQGLDLFDKLANVCSEVRSILETEIQDLERQADAFPELLPTTEVGRATAQLAQWSGPLIEELAVFSVEDSELLERSQAELARVNGSDPKRSAITVRLCLRRLKELVQELAKQQSAISPAVLHRVAAAQAKAKSCRDAAALASAAAFGDEPLPGVGSEVWRALWESARRYAERFASSAWPLPALTDEARCVLCQQVLSLAARDRMTRFEEFVRADAERAATVAEADFQDASQALRVPWDAAKLSPALDEVQALDEPLAARLRERIALIVDRRNAVVQALATGDWSGIVPEEPAPIEDHLPLVMKLEGEAAAFDRANEPMARARLTKDIAELSARRRLVEIKGRVFAQIARLKRIESLRSCLTHTETRTLTMKASELTKATVTDALCAAFEKEVSDLGLSGVKVELANAGARSGVLFHQVRLKAPRTPAKTCDVLSEGESRCIAIASFLTELATADHTSAIVLDDPVSSLDHRWRRSIARRLAAEAKRRQVVVFTHDIFFLFMLQRAAEEVSVAFASRCVQRTGEGCGRTVGDLPWHAMRVKDRLKWLREEFNRVQAFHKQNDRVAYEREAKCLYGQLRETWERAVEEVLLNDVVQRFDIAIHTNQLRHMDITPEDYATIEVAMTKTSSWISGHDQPGSVNAPVPGPVELKGDIDSLDNWAKSVRKRREKGAPALQVRSA